MNNMHRRKVSLAVFAATTMLAACSGGGGNGTPPSSPMTAVPVLTSTPVASPVPTASPAPTASATPTASPTPSPTPEPVTASGQIIDHDTNNALPGAVVYISHTLVIGATPPATAPSDGGMATTNSAGGYTITLPAQSSYPARFYIEAFPPNSARSVAHDILTVSAAGSQAVPTIGLTTLSSDEAGWLALVNQDRASYNTAPVVTDETTQELARLWLAWVAQNHYEHDCASTDVNCPNKTAFIASENADFNTNGENIDNSPSNYEGADQAFMAEASNCPQPAMYSTCPFAENTGHFLNTINPNAYWFGSSDTMTGAPYEGSGSSNYYDEELSNPNIAGAQINLRTRSSVIH